jgi:hypothetical protein
MLLRLAIQKPNSETQKSKISLSKIYQDRSLQMMHACQLKACSFFSLITFFASTSLCAGENLDPTKTVIADRHFDKNNCVMYLHKINPALARTMMEDAKYIVEQDMITYVAGGDSITKELLTNKTVQGYSGSHDIEQTRKNLKELQNFQSIFSSSEYSLLEKKKAVQRFSHMFKPSPTTQEAANAKSYLSYITCREIEALKGANNWSDAYKQYESYIKAHKKSSQVGYFSITINSSTSQSKVGTGNTYAEPKPSTDSRFFIIDASFRNTDTESRLPFEGSLLISYEGKEYEYDAVEPIMLEGYNIWFRKINPLITIRTKIVYRIPNEIEGEVFWRPGRNNDGTQLWAGYIKTSPNVAISTRPQ